MSTDPALVMARGLSWSPPDGERAILHDLDISIAEGESVAVVGASGSGKTALLRCLIGLEPSKGMVRVRDRELAEDTVLEIRRIVAYVAQTPTAIAATAAAELDFLDELQRGARERVLALCERFGLDRLQLDRSVERLSGGERQRWALARALGLRPGMLLLDEPTSSLDEDNVERVEETVSGWLAEDASRAALWVTHDREQARRVASRVLTLADGRLHEGAER